jgi:hypothetical protein
MGGAIIDVMALITAPLKVADLHEQPGGRGSRPRGAGMGSSSCVTACTSTATTGVWPSPTGTGAAGSGSKKAIMAPSGGP